MGIKLSVVRKVAPVLMKGPVPYCSKMFHSIRTQCLLSSFYSKGITAKVDMLRNKQAVKALCKKNI